jgi:hypothetical protein
LPGIHFAVERMLVNGGFDVQRDTEIHKDAVLLRNLCRHFSYVVA